MYLLFTCGVALWLVYGLLLEAWPIIAANAVTLVLAGTVLTLKLRHGWAAAPRPHSRSSTPRPAWPAAGLRAPTPAGFDECPVKAYGKTGARSFLPALCHA